MSRGRGQARTGEIKRTAGGWAVRYRDGQGVRKQRGGFRTKAEAKVVLDEELRKARLGPLYRPDATLQQLVDAFLDQYQGAPSSKDRLDQYLGKATARFGDERAAELNALEVSRWRATLPETMRHGAHQALRQALGAAVKWQWIERSVAADVPNPTHARVEFQPFETWDEVEALAVELGPFGPLAIFSVGTGVRPEEAFGGEWGDVDLEAGVFTVRRSFAKGRLKNYAKTERSRRRIPLRAKVIDALNELPRREGILFPIGVVEPSDDLARRPQLRVRARDGHRSRTRPPTPTGTSSTTPNTHHLQGTLVTSSPWRPSQSGHTPHRDRAYIASHFGESQSRFRQ